MSADIIPEITIGNFIGPGLAALTLYLTNYWQSKTSRQKELDSLVVPLNEKLGNLAVTTKDFVPKHEIDARFLAVEGRQLTVGMDVKELREDIIELRVKQGQTDEAMKSTNASIAEIKDQQKEMLRILNEIRSSVRHDRQGDA